MSFMRQCPAGRLEAEPFPNSPGSLRYRHGAADSAAAIAITPSSSPVTYYPPPGRWRTSLACAHGRPRCAGAVGVLRSRLAFGLALDGDLRCFPLASAVRSHNGLGPRPTQSLPASSRNLASELILFFDRIEPSNPEACSIR